MIIEFSLLRQNKFLQGLAVIKLIEKKKRGKRYIKNRRPISFLNFDTKILSKAISDEFKTVLPRLISSQ